MATEYNGLLTPLVAIDTASGLKPSLEYTYGPYTSVDNAYDTILSKFGASSIPVGLTVGIKEGNTITEYWFNGGTARSNLVEKMPKGDDSTIGSGGIKITVTESILEDTNTVLNGIAPNASPGDQVIDTANENLYICYSTGKWFKIVGAILTDAAATVTRIINANVLSYK